MDPSVLEEPCSSKRVHHRIPSRAGSRRALRIQPFLKNQQNLIRIAMKVYEAPGPVMLFGNRHGQTTGPLVIVMNSCPWHHAPVSRSATRRENSAPAAPGHTDRAAAGRSPSPKKPLPQPPARGNLLAPSFRSAENEFLDLTHLISNLGVALRPSLIDDPARLVVEAEVMQHMSGVPVIHPFKIGGSGHHVSDIGDHDPPEVGPDS